MPYNGKLHLFAVMNDLDTSGNVLVVMVTSIKYDKHGNALWYDPACVLQNGDHRFITHDSYLAYSIAETPRVIHVHNMIQQKYFICDDDFSSAVYTKIRNGLYGSSETRQRIVNYSTAQGI